MQIKLAVAFLSVVPLLILASPAPAPAPISVATRKRSFTGANGVVDIAALNSRVKFDKMDVPFEQREILGDATETGLARFAGRQLQDYDRHQTAHPKVFEVPFNSTNKWMLTIVHSATDPEDRTLLIKGAPDRLFDACTTALTSTGDIVPFDLAYFRSIQDSWAGEGLRVLALCRRSLAGTKIRFGPVTRLRNRSSTTDLRS